MAAPRRRNAVIQRSYRHRLPDISAHLIALRLRALLFHLHFRFLGLPCREVVDERV